MTKYCFIVIAVLYCALTYAQSPTIFHRGYPLYPAAGAAPDTSVLNISGLQLKDGNYVSLDGMIPQGDSTVHFFLITKYLKKGDIAWTKKIAAGSNLGTSGFGSIYQGTNDSIYFSVTLFDGNNKQLIGALEPKNGNGLWMKAYDNSPNNEIVANIAANLIVEGTGDSLVHQLLNFTDDDGNQLIFNKLKRNGDMIVSKSYKFEDSTKDAYDYSVVDYAAVNDGFISTGNASAQSGGLPIAVFTKFDKDDNPILNKVYASSEAEFFPFYSGIKIANIGKDYVIAGQYYDLNFQDFLSSYLGSFVLKVDSIGNVVWSKIIDKTFAPFNSINGLTVDKDENIIISGKVLYNFSDFHPFMVSVDKDGKQNWLNIYEKSTGDISTLGELFTTMDKGYGYFHYDIDNPTDNILKGAFIKTDDKGKVGCETKLEDILLVDNAFVSDTLFSTIDTIEAKNIEFVPTSGTVSFDIPILSLNIRPFCPNEKIDWTFDANVRDAVKWEWSDNSKADTLRVFSTGEYSVTVTIDGKYCFMLCDTATVERTDLPQVQALQGPNVCIGAPFTITSSFNAASSVSSKWTKEDGTVVGTNVGSITTSTLGKYTVTIIDQCGDSAKSTITIDESIYFPAPSGFIIRGIPVCKNTEFTLRADGVGGGGGPYTFLWSENGATTSEIKVNKLGTYKVTVTDKCGLTAIQTINVDESVWLPAPTAAISAGATKVCKNTPFILSGAAVGGGGEPYQYLWSTGGTTEVITVDKLGSYALTVTDKCGLTNTKSVNVGSEVYYADPTVSIETSPDNTFCQTGKIGLIATPTSEAGGTITYAWSNGGNAAETLVDGNGSYNVTITDRCSNTATASKDVTDATAGSNCVKFPKIFMPDAQLIEENKLFGGINLCGVDSASVNGYVLNVFNRWGQPVFTSTDITKGWNGRNDNDDSYAPDVYVWYSRYNVGKFCKTETKGDVTLFR